MIIEEYLKKLQGNLFKKVYAVLNNKGRHSDIIGNVDFQAC